MSRLKIVLAVSGGVDSVVMLHSIVQRSSEFKMGLEFIVAHFDHGIRKDSESDARFVEALAASYGVQYEAGRGDLATTASEATARKARWDFLHTIKNKHDAIGIMTAHHADDLLETVVINLLRGTGRRGLSVLGNTDSVIRPLIKNTKSEIYDYAVKHSLEFVEDDSNNDHRYLRNKVRHLYLPKLESRLAELKSYIQTAERTNPQIDLLIDRLCDNELHDSDNELSLPKDFLRTIPDSVAREVMREMMERSGVIHDKQKLSSDMIEQLLQFAKRTDSNKTMHISKQLHAQIDRTNVVIHRINQNSSKLNTRVE